MLSKYFHSITRKSREIIEPPIFNLHFVHFYGTKSELFKKINERFSELQNGYPARFSRLEAEKRHISALMSPSPPGGSTGAGLGDFPPHIPWTTFNTFQA